MVLLFYVDECLMLSPSKDEIDEVYISLQSYFKIEDDEDLNKYLGGRSGTPPRWINPSKVALSNPNNTQHDFRHGQVKC